MRVLFIVPHPIEGPSSRFRVYQYLPYLNAHGVHTCVRPLVSSQQVQALYQQGGTAKKLGLTLYAALNRSLDTLRARSFDIVYILREAFPFGPAWFEQAIAAGKRLVYDFDDAIWLPTAVHNNPLDRFRDWNKPAQLVARAQHVVVGSEHLAAFARPHSRSPESVTIIPTVVDAAAYGQGCAQKAKGALTIGWVGTPRGSKAFLQPLLPTMQAFAKDYPQVRWRFVGAEPFEVGTLPVEFVRWQLENEVAAIQSFDIGLMPLTDDAFTRGKCGFKLIQYMHCGMPVVCSPVGANCDIVEAGITGLFATQPADWEAQLRQLIEQPQLRAQMASAGQQKAIQQYSLAGQAPRLLQVLQKVMLET